LVILMARSSFAPMIGGWMIRTASMNSGWRSTEIEGQRDDAGNAVGPSARR
jgi:hypothetical protein